MLISFSEEKVISDLFKEWAIDTCAIHLGADDFKAEVRCAITAYSHHIQNILADYYEINQEEGE